MSDEPVHSLCETCKEREGEPDHTCPHRVAADDDNETLCNCCSQCEDECWFDV